MIDHAVLMTRAAMLRRRLGEDSSSPVDILALAQGIEGLTIVYYPLGERLSGMCVKGQGNNHLIAVNSAMTLGRQRFSMAHEFYHLYFDRNMVSVCAKKMNTGKDTERSADMFASYFLMPDAALCEMAGKLADRNPDGLLTLDDVIRIEQFFGISHKAAVFRLMHTQYLDSGDGEDFLKAAVRRRAAAMGYSPDLYLPSPGERRYMTYGSYIVQAERVFEKRLVSAGKYEELLMDAFRTDLVYGDGEKEDNVVD